MTPPDACVIRASACLQHRNVPRALTAKTCSQTSRVVSGALVVEPTPATFISIPTGPSSSAAAKSASTELSSLTSAATARPGVTRPATVASAASESTSAATTEAPFRLSVSASALPMPEPAPVTTATRPANSALSSITPIRPRGRHRRGDRRRRPPPGC